MPEKQLRLLRPARPLVERLGVEFFRAIPECPGVYLMRGARRQLLYVGKAGNLRKRLGSYRYVIPERGPRKTIRLLHAVESISWERCESEAAACLRENELLREQRPHFNRMHTYPKAYCFIEVRGVRRHESAEDPSVCHEKFEPTDQISGPLSLRLTTDPSEHCHGAFKGPARPGFHALLRLLWCATNGAKPYETLPRTLILERPPREFSFDADERWGRRVHSFFTGASDELVAALGEQSAAGSAFHRGFHQSDLDLLAYFFERGPRRNRILRQQFCPSAKFIPQEQLDDLLVLSGRTRANVKLEWQSGDAMRPFIFVPAAETM